MDACPVCDRSSAEVLKAALNDYYRVTCPQPDCGTYEVTGTVMEGGNGFRSLDDEERRHALDKAKRRAKFGALPVISSMCLSW